MAEPGLIRQVLQAVPQQEPFRFIDDINELDSDHIVGSYRFRADEFFYRGHFPGRPITPGVVLVESMAQVAVVAFGLYLLMADRDMPPERVAEITTLFSVIEELEFAQPVWPGEKVITRGDKIYLRRSSLKVKAAMHKEDGTLVCHGILMGTGARL